MRSAPPSPSPLKLSRGWLVAQKLEKEELECVTTCYKKFLGFQSLVQKHWQLENERMVEEQQLAEQQQRE